LAPVPVGNPVDRTDRVDQRLVPLAVSLWTAAWIGTGGSRTAWAIMLATTTVVGLVAARRRSTRASAAALLLAAGLLLGWAAQQRLATGPVADLAAAEAVAKVVLVTTGDPVLHPSAGVRPPYLTVRGRLVQVEGRGEAWQTRAPVLVSVSGPATEIWRVAPVGTTLTASARLQPRLPGSDLAALVRVRGPTSVTAAPGSGLRAVERVRAGLRTAVADRRPEPRALVPALVLGDTSALTAATTDDFAVTGLTHLTAVSGANLTLLLAFLLLAARWLGVRGWWLRAVGLFGVVIFVALCRTEPSVLRAAAMGLVALAALGSGSTRAGVRNLCVAAMALLGLDPLLSRSLGFALSVLASGGIIWWARRWAAVLGTWLPRLVAEAVAVPLAAHLATVAVAASISGTVSVVGLLANAVAGPFVGPATVFGFAAAGLSLVHPAAAMAAGFVAAWSAQPIIWVAHAGARLPGAALDWPAEPLALLLLGSAALSAGLLMPRLLARRWLSLLAATGLVAGLAVVPSQPGWPPRDWVLVACDVGQGDGLVLRVGPGQGLVVDTGPDPARMERCLDQLGVNQVPLLILTHFDADHAAGLTGVPATARVQQIWTGPDVSPSAGTADVGRLANDGVSVRVPAAGEGGRVGEASWEILGPRTPLASEPVESSSASNDSSLVVMVTIRGIRVLLTGDVEPPGQSALLAAGVDLRADVLKVPHHGSSRQEPAFFAATGARVAIVSAGLDNDYGHPTPQTQALVAALGMTLLRTDEQGNVAVTVRSGRLGAVSSRR
jgi:competence protein ComEC